MPKFYLDNKNQKMSNTQDSLSENTNNNIQNINNNLNNLNQKENQLSINNEEKYYIDNYSMNVTYEEFETCKHFII